MTLTTADWNRVLNSYAKPDFRSSLKQLILTLTMLFAAVIVAHLGRHIHWSLGIPGSVMAGVVIVRVFIIQHDCGHRSFFKNAKTCDWIGRFLSLFTLTPYGFWKRDHDQHHATAGHLDKRGAGDVTTLTVEEYLSLSRFKRIQYRLYRHPVVMFGLGPAWQFLLRNRLPLWLGTVAPKKQAISIMVHNCCLIAFFGILSWMLGWTSVLAVWLPAVLIAASIGVWLFFIQHQFENTYWKHKPEWSFVEAALNGCSFYRLPNWMHWLTGWIGYHHIHHLSSKIPNYRLAKVFQEIPQLQNAPSFGILESLKCAKLALWCEKRQRLVSFREALA